MKTSSLMKKLPLIASGVALSTCFIAVPEANASLITHTAQSFTGTITAPIGPLASPVGTFYIGSGVDYSFGNVEGVFSDPPLAFCGINTSNICDLVTAVDAQIVLPNTTTQGLTNFLSLEAGFATEGSLTLTAFDHALNPIASATNGLPLGPNGRTTITIDRGSVFDIAFFSVSGGDEFGVNEVTIGSPISKAVPEPTSVLGLLAIGALGAGSALTRKLLK